jgi:hypothetical protein
VMFLVEKADGQTTDDMIQNKSVKFSGADTINCFAGFKLSKNICSILF